MCGLFGQFLFEGDFAQADILAMRTATATLAHRGPDHQGEWTARGVYLGHRRLSIIDLSSAANQPYQKANGILSFNGEIYNFVELRRDLERLGHRFETASDTEVLAAALRQWDVDAFSRLDGMFAGAWHDLDRRRHVLFRDPLGQKPLYWCETGRGILYASELRALLALPEPTWRLDREAFQRFLANGYYGWTETPVRGIRKVPPGCLIMAESGKIEQRRYWHSVPTGETGAELSEGAALDQLEELLRQTCRRIIRADVPYGVFLSGGIDSSLALDFCHEANADVAAFSIAMADADFDESGKARMVARSLGVKRHEVFTLSQPDVVGCFREVMRSLDEPHGDPGLVNSYFLARSVRPHITVGIAGDGGDELFAGYMPFAGLSLARWVRRSPSGLISLLRGAAAALPDSDGYLGLRFKALAYLQGFPACDSLRLPLWLAAESPEALSRLFTDRIEPSEARFGTNGLFGPYFDVMRQVEGATSVAQSLQFYQQVFLPEFVCMHTDRAAMLCSLEVRSPFLAPDVIAFANRLPDRMKVHGRSLKWLLRRLAARRGHDSSIVAQAKQGFTFPLARWMKGSMRRAIEELIFDPAWKDDGLVDAAEVERRFTRHMAGAENSYRLIYNLAVFRAWRKSYPQVLAC